MTMKDLSYPSFKIIMYLLLPDLVIVTEQWNLLCVYTKRVKPQVTVAITMKFCF